jgi:solute carrier family 25 (mitochondrial carnitine/acylcarnitine transporter), member 20/29
MSDVTMEDSGTTAFSKRHEDLVTRALKDFVAGWIGGVAQVMTGQPFDTIKVRLQTQSSAYTLGQGTVQSKYEGALDCALKTMRQEGPAGFYRVNPRVYGLTG